MPGDVVCCIVGACHKYTQRYGGGGKNGAQEAKDSIENKYLIDTYHINVIKEGERKKFASSPYGSIYY